MAATLPCPRLRHDIVFTVAVADTRPEESHVSVGLLPFPTAAESGGGGGDRLRRRRNSRAKLGRGRRKGRKGTSYKKQEERKEGREDIKKERKKERKEKKKGGDNNSSATPNVREVSGSHSAGSATFNPSVSQPCSYCLLGSGATFLVDELAQTLGGRKGEEVKWEPQHEGLTGGRRAGARCRFAIWSELYVRRHSIDMFSFSFVAKPRGLERVPVARGRGRGGSGSDGGGRRGSGSEAQRSRRGSAASLSGSMPPNLSMSTILALKKRSKKWTRGEYAQHLTYLSQFSCEATSLLIELFPSCHVSSTDLSRNLCGSHFDLCHRKFEIWILTFKEKAVRASG